MIGEGCIIRNGAQLSSCIIGPSVVIGKDKVVENIRLQSERPLGGDYTLIHLPSFVLQGY